MMMIYIHPSNRRRLPCVDWEAELDAVDIELDLLFQLKNVIKLIIMKTPNVKRFFIARIQTIARVVQG
jgi:hypothetical protein